MSSQPAAVSQQAASPAAVPCNGAACNGSDISSNRSGEVTADDDNSNCSGRTVPVEAAEPTSKCLNHPHATNELRHGSDLERAQPSNVAQDCSRPHAADQPTVGQAAAWLALDQAPAAGQSTRALRSAASPTAFTSNVVMVHASDSSGTEGTHANSGGGESSASDTWPDASQPTSKHIHRRAAPKCICSPAPCEAGPSNMKRLRSGPPTAQHTAAGPAAAQVQAAAPGTCATGSPVSATVTALHILRIKSADAGTLLQLPTDLAKVPMSMHLHFSIGPPDKEPLRSCVAEARRQGTCRLLQLVRADWLPISRELAATLPQGPPELPPGTGVMLARGASGVVHIWLADGAVPAARDNLAAPRGPSQRLLHREAGTSAAAVGCANAAPDSSNSSSTEGSDADTGQSSGSAGNLMPAEAAQTSTAGCHRRSAAKRNRSLAADEAGPSGVGQKRSTRSRSMPAAAKAAAAQPPAAAQQPRGAAAAGVAAAHMKAVVDLRNKVLRIRAFVVHALFPAATTKEELPSCINFALGPPGKALLTTHRARLQRRKASWERMVLRPDWVPISRALAPALPHSPEELPPGTEVFVARGEGDIVHIWLADGAPPRMSAGKHGAGPAAVPCSRAAPYVSNSHSSSSGESGDTTSGSGASGGSGRTAPAEPAQPGTVCLDRRSAARQKGGAVPADAGPSSIGRKRNKPPAANQVAAAPRPLQQPPRSAAGQRQGQVQDMPPVMPPLALPAAHSHPHIPAGRQEPHRSHARGVRRLHELAASAPLQHRQQEGGEDAAVPPLQQRPAQQGTAAAGQIGDTGGVPAAPVNGGLQEHAQRPYVQALWMPAMRSHADFLQHLLQDATRDTTSGDCSDLAGLAAVIGSNLTQMAMLSGAATGRRDVQ